MFVSQRRDQPVKVELHAFLALQILGGLGNVAMLGTAVLSRRVNRSSTWINFCITWIIYSVSYTLLLYAGQQTNAAGPVFPLCLAQAGLIYGAPLLAACSSLSLVIQIWLSVRALVSSSYKESTYSPVAKLMLVVVPYVAWFCMVLGAFIFGATHTETIQRAGSDVYCIISTGIPGHVSSVLVVVILITGAIFQCLVVRIVYRDVRLRMEMRSPNQISVSMVVRLGVFLLLSVSTICQVIVFDADKFLVANIYIAMMPVIAFLLFATQRDILCVWAFWK